jgi:hypothetical protein
MFDMSYIRLDARQYNIDQSDHSSLMHDVIVDKFVVYLHYVDLVPVDRHTPVHRNPLKIVL